MYSFDKRRHREALWLIATGSLLGLIAAGGYLMLPLGYPEAARYFGSPPERELQSGRGRTAPNAHGGLLPALRDGG